MTNPTQENQATTQVEETIEAIETVETTETVEVTEDSNVEKDATVEIELSETDILTAQIGKLELQLKDAKEAQARANAESYNAQRRMEQETDKVKKFALQKFVKELLEVADNFERAIVSAETIETDKTVVEGLQLTHKSLVTALEKQGVVVINPLGEKFNPDFHEAVGIFPDAEPDHVGVVLQKGYTLNGRSIRPAMVQIGA